MWLGVSLYKKRENYLEVELYKSIDNLPQWNWNKIHQTGNLAYLKKLDTYRNVESDLRCYLEIIFDNIYDDYIEEFGFSSRFLEIQEKKKEIARLKNKFIQTDEQFILTLIDIEEIDLNNLLKEGGGDTFESICVEIEKRTGIEVDPRKITVYRYNNYLRNFKDKANGE